MRINLPIHSYDLRSRPSSSSRLVNCYPELLPPGARAPILLSRAPGITAWTTVGTGPIRALYKAPIDFATGQKEYLYVVSGEELYYVDTDKTATLIGNIGTPGRIDIDSNITSVVVVNEPRAYAFNGVVYTGTHTGGNDQSGDSNEPMTDSAADWDEDELIGYRIKNTTDGGEGVIIDNDKTTVTVTRLRGGTGDDWDTNDAYIITGFQEILDDDFTSRGAGDVEFMDNFLLFREPNSARFFGADLGSATSFDALQFAVADTSPDNLVGMLGIHRQLIMFGANSGEIFENTGAAGFPFERNINGTFNEGCLSAGSIAMQDNVAFWVADDYTVRRLDGIVPVRVSNHAVEQWLSGVTVNSLEGFSYDQDGHFFYGLSADEGTWVLDVTTNEWHERETYGKDNWLPRYFERFAGKQLVGDWDSNKIGYLDFGTYTEWGTTQRMEWTYQPVFAEGIRAFHDRLEIVLETGVGLTTGQGSDPKVMLEYSDDGGMTWQAMPDRTFGKLGERLSRCVWHNLGSSRQRVYRCAVSDPVEVSVTDTLLEVRGGRL